MGDSCRAGRCGDCDAVLFETQWRIEDVSTAKVVLRSAIGTIAEAAHIGGGR